MLFDLREMRGATFLFSALRGVNAENVSVDRDEEPRLILDSLFGQAQDSREPGAWSRERMIDFGRHIEIETSDFRL